MIVKILSSSASFKGVRYNTDKIDKDKGELLKVSGFGPLQAINRLRPEDYIGYLKMVSAQNKGVRSPQFHVAISTKGRNHSKTELLEIAEKWLGTMGYAKQPYLIIFHKDTRNNHVHIVSSRIDKEGKKISSAFEKNRSIQNLNKVMKLDEQWTVKTDLEKAFKYNFSTKAQFLLILECMNYKVRMFDDKIELIKYGKVLANIKPEEVTKKIQKEKERKQELKTVKAEYPKNTRAKQLSAFFHKYKDLHSTQLMLKTESLPGGRHKHLSAYESDFSIFMKEKLGIEIIYHANPGLKPYGYTVLDHAEKNVFKGGEIVDIKELLTVKPQHSILTAVSNIEEQTLELEKEIRLSSQSSDVKGSNDLISADPQNAKVTDSIESAQDSPSFNNIYEPLDTDYIPISEQISIQIADDIDDEAILGRNRRRQKKARTNTR